MIDSPIQAIINFNEVFLQRYCTGSAYGPPFIISSLQETLDRSFETSKVEDVSFGVALLNSFPVLLSLARDCHSILSELTAYYNHRRIDCIFVQYIFH